MFGYFRKKKVGEQETVNRIEEAKEKAIKDATVILTKGIAEAFEMIDHRNEDRFAKLESLIRHVEPVSSKPEAQVRQPDIAEGDQVSVYAFYFKYRHSINAQYTMNANDQMLSIVLAKDESEAIQKAEKIMRDSGYTPADWEMRLSNQLPILVKGKKPSDIQKERPIDTYISNLEYAREKFTETPHEKGVITKIINKIQKQHVTGSNTQ